MAEHLHGYPRCETPVGTSCTSSDLNWDECKKHGALRACEASVVDGIPTGQYRCSHDEAAPARPKARPKKAAKAKAKPKKRAAARKGKARKAARKPVRKSRRAAKKKGAAKRGGRKGARKKK